MKNVNFEIPTSGIACKCYDEDMPTISSPYDMSLRLMHEFAVKPNRLRECGYP